MTQYVIYSILKDELKESVNSCKKTFGIVNWKEITYVTALSPLYIYESKEAAIKYVRNLNRTSLCYIYFYIELNTYKS